MSLLSKNEGLYFFLLYPKKAGLGSNWQDLDGSDTVINHLVGTFFSFDVIQRKGSGRLKNIDNKCINRIQHILKKLKRSVAEDPSLYEKASGWGRHRNNREPCVRWNRQNCWIAFRNYSLRSLYCNCFTWIDKLRPDASKMDERL